MNEDSTKIPELIEIRNETKRTITVSACRSKISNRLYVHIGKAHGNETKVKPLDYAIIQVNEVDF